MKLLTLDEAMAGPPRYYRVSVTAQWGIVVVFGGVIAWVGWLGWHARGQSLLGGALLAWVALWLGLFWALMLNDLRKALKPSAWLVATSDEGLFIKWRSYQNIGWGLDGVQVLLLEWREIRRARVLAKTWITTGSRGGRRRFEQTSCVELDVAPRVLLDEVRIFLANERDGRPGGVKRKTKWGHFPVSIESNSTIRIEWRARPSLRHFMEEVAVWVDVEAEAQSTTDATTEEVTDGELLELAGRGNVMPLIAALRRRDGLSLVEAKERAELMMADAKGGSAADSGGS